MKKLFTILAAAFVVSMAACNGSGDAPAEDTTKKDTTAQMEQPVTAPVDTTAHTDTTAH